MWGKDGNPIPYRVALIDKIWLAKVEYIERNAGTIRKRNIADVDCKLAATKRVNKKLLLTKE